MCNSSLCEKKIVVYLKPCSYEASTKHFFLVRLLLTSETVNVRLCKKLKISVFLLPLIHVVTQFSFGNNNVTDTQRK